MLLSPGLRSHFGLVRYGIVVEAAIVAHFSSVAKIMLVPLTYVFKPFSESIMHDQQCSTTHQHLVQTLLAEDRSWSLSTSPAATPQDPAIFKWCGIGTTYFSGTCCLTERERGMRLRVRITNTSKTTTTHLLQSTSLQGIFLIQQHFPFDSKSFCFFHLKEKSRSQKEEECGTKMR